MIYFVEGIFGTGKSTHAEKLLQNLQEDGMGGRIFYEHEIDNPLDFTRKACLTEVEYAKLLNELQPVFEDIYGAEDIARGLDKISGNSVLIDGHRWIALYKIGYTDERANNIIRALHSREICNGNVDYEQYSDCYLRMWTYFAGTIEKNRSYIFEGALLQNPLLDLVGCYQLSDRDILLFYERLMSVLDGREAEIHYVLTDSVEKTVLKVADERVHSKTLWIDSLIKWSEGCPYVQSRSLSGMNGMFRLCEEFERVQLLICDKLGIPTKVIKREL